MVIIPSGTMKGCFVLSSEEVGSFIVSVQVHGM